MPGDKILRPIEVNKEKQIIVYSVDEDGNVFAEPDVSVIDGHYAISPAYWLEIRDTLKNCAEFVDYEKKIREMN